MKTKYTEDDLDDYAQSIIVRKYINLQRELEDMGGYHLFITNELNGEKGKPMFQVNGGHVSSMDSLRFRTLVDVARHFNINLEHI